MVKNLLAVQQTWVQSLSWENLLEKGMATYSSILAWRFHGQRSLVGYSPCGGKESDTESDYHFHFSYSPIHIPLLAGQGLY